MNILSNKFCASKCRTKVTYCFSPFYFPQSFYKQVYTKFIPDFYITSGTGQVSWWLQEEIFWFLSSSFCEGGLQQIQKISIQAL